jgi:diguanylate cyclase (GGDEF)-like protein
VINRRHRAIGARAPMAAWSRVATVGLVVIVLVVSGFALWASQTTARAARQAAAATRLATDYTGAVQAVNDEETLELTYRLAPSDKIRSEHAAAAHRLVDNLTAVAGEGNDTDAAGARTVLLTHARYLVAADKLFTAVDRRDDALVRRLHADEAAPIFRYIKTTVELAADKHRTDSRRQIAEMRRVSTTMASGIPLVFLVGIALAAMFATVLRRYRKDLDQQRRQAEYDSRHDTLSGLANRELLAERLDEAIDTGERVGLVLLDLDRFKEINDALGHRYGDELLAQIGPRLAGTVRATDTIARLGGDEFAVLLPDVSHLEAALNVAEKLRAATEQPFQIGGADLMVEASAGVVVSGEHGDDAQTLMRRAEVAMYVAKSRKRGIAVYEPAEDSHDPSRLALLGELRRALEQRELVLFYQPKINLVTGAVAGVEALVRWQHPQRGMVMPDRFIPLAEHTGLVAPLTRYVVDEALRQARRWADEGRPLSVAVNLAARNLGDVELFDDVITMLKIHGVPPERLTLELTESAITTEPAHAQTLMTRLRGAGIALAIDDFGAGYTSLAQLKNLPVTELKIDRSFVGTMTTERSNGLIVRSVVDLARNLGLSTVAEGVEDAETLAALAAYGCSMAQGYHMSRPLARDAFDAWYDSHRTPVPLPQ